MERCEVTTFFKQCWSYGASVWRTNRGMTHWTKNQKAITPTFSVFRTCPTQKEKFREKWFIIWSVLANCHVPTIPAVFGIVYSSPSISLMSHWTYFWWLPDPSSELQFKHTHSLAHNIHVSIYIHDVHECINTKETEDGFWVYLLRVTLKLQCGQEK